MLTVMVRRVRMEIKKNVKPHVAGLVLAIVIYLGRYVEFWAAN